MNGVYISHNNMKTSALPFEWLVKEVREKVVNYTMRTFETIHEARVWALELAETLIKELNMSQRATEVVFMDEVAASAMMHDARKFMQIILDESGEGYNIRGSVGGVVIRSNPFSTFAAAAEVALHNIVEHLKVDPKQADVFVFTSLEVVAREFTTIPEESTPEWLATPEAFRNFVHLDFTQQMIDRLKESEMALRVGDLLKLFSNVGAMIREIDNQFARRAFNATTVEQRVDLSEERTRRVAEVERHLIEVFTFVAPSLIDAWKKLTEPDEEVSE